MDRRAAARGGRRRPRERARRHRAAAAARRRCLRFVAGRGCEYDVLAAAVDVPPGALLDALDEAERANLITSSRAGAAVRLTFTHELIRETLLGSVSLPRLQRLHLRFADAIASRTAGDDREADIAHHPLRAGSLAEPARTVRHALAAASRAMTATAFEQAAAL